MHVEIVTESIDEERIRNRVSRPANGAVLLFHGVVRDHHEGKAVSHIDYHAYVEMAHAELEAVGREIAARHGIEDLAIVHRIGVVAVGESSLLVAAGAPHRRPAFEAALEVIDELKRRVPIWKKEYGPDGSHWVGGVMPRTPEDEVNPG